jgi:hypothetical protein
MPWPRRVSNIQNSVRLSNDATFGNALKNTEGFTLYFFAQRLVALAIVLVVALMYD